MGKKNRNNFFIFRLKIRSGHIYLAAANDCATICHEQRQHLKEFKIQIFGQNQRNGFAKIVTRNYQLEEKAIDLLDSDGGEGVGY